MEKLNKVVDSIGNSEKKSQSWLNGQFGYGIYSFLAICDTMEIRTKHANNDYSEYIKITKKDFLIDDLSNLKFEIVRENPHVPVSGTEVTLSGFSKEAWLDIDPQLLKSEIENHFELLLHNQDD
jgi:HSP90 family molecular chaperone